MAKVKLTKNDITTDNVELPEGYKITKYKTNDELIAENLVEADRLEAGLGNEPADQELIELGKIDHPYYQTISEIERLRN